MASDSSSIKWLIYVFNLIFFAAGVGIFVYGLKDYLGTKELINIPMIHFKLLPIALMVVGAITAIVALFGFCGAVHENRCMIIVFATILLALLIIEIGTVSAVFITRKVSPEVINETKHTFFKNYYEDNNIHNTIDILQKNFKCCGANNYSDWSILNSTEIPWSCCSRDNRNDTSPCDMQEAYQVGCLDAIIQFLYQYKKLIGGVVIGVVITEFIGVILAFCLAKSIKDTEDLDENLVRMSYLN